MEELKKTKISLAFILGGIMVMIYLLIFGVVILYLLYQNHNVKITQYICANSSIGLNFDGYKIIQISDLHGDLPFDKLDRIERILENEKPDMVVITGDIIDNLHLKYWGKIMGFLDFIEKYNVYYVTGNHEYMHDECRNVILEIEKRKIKVLHGERVNITRAESIMFVYGIDDPYVFYGENIPAKYKTPHYEFIQKLSKIKVEKNRFSILLTHRPEFFEYYVESGFNLVLAGHAHGGQWIIPGLGGVIAPDQGLLPKYVKGKYIKKDTTMIVSRGLGNSVVPLRIFNEPEIVEIILKSAY